MILKSSLLAALAAPLLIAGAAVAETPADAPVASAANATLDAQISSYLDAASQDAAPVTTARSLGPTPDAPVRDKAVHGEVGVGVGTGGYREFHAVMVAPLGETGTVAMAIGQTRGRGLRGSTDLGLMAAFEGAGEGAPLRSSAAPASALACPSAKDKPGAEPLWIARMRASQPAATLDCPPDRAGR